MKVEGAEGISQLGYPVWWEKLPEEEKYNAEEKNDCKYDYGNKAYLAYLLWKGK